MSKPAEKHRGHNIFEREQEPVGDVPREIKKKEQKKEMTILQEKRQGDAVLTAGCLSLTAGRCLAASSLGIYYQRPLYVCTELVYLVTVTGPSTTSFTEMSKHSKIALCSRREVSDSHGESVAPNPAFRLSVRVFSIC